MLIHSITIKLHTDENGNDYFTWESDRDMDGSEMVEWLEQFLDAVTQPPVVFTPERNLRLVK